MTLLRERPRVLQTDSDVALAGVCGWFSSHCRKTHNMTPEPHVAHSTQHRVQRAAGGGFWSLKLESKKQTSGGFVSSHLTGKN